MKEKSKLEKELYIEGTRLLLKVLSSGKLSGDGQTFQVWPYLNSQIKIKLPFFSAGTSPKFSHFPHKVNYVSFSSISWDTKNTFYYQCDADNYMDHVLDFLLFDKHKCIHEIFRPAILVSIFVTGFCSFFFVLQDLIDRIKSYFQRIVFQRNLLLIGF